MAGTPAAAAAAMASRNVFLVVVTLQSIYVVQMLLHAVVSVHMGTLQNAPSYSITPKQRRRASGTTSPVAPPRMRAILVLLVPEDA